GACPNRAADSSRVHTVDTAGIATWSRPATSPVEPAEPQPHPGLSRTAAPDTLQRDVTGVATSWTNDAGPARHRAAPPGSRSKPTSRINQQPRPTPQTLLDGALAGVLPSVKLTAVQVVPPALDADLDDVTRELIVIGVEPLELGGRRDAPAVRGLEAIAVHIRHQAQTLVAAYRTCARGFTEVARHAQQLRMGVAHFESFDVPRSKVAQHGSTSEGVVDVPAHGWRLLLTKPR